MKRRPATEGATPCYPARGARPWLAAGAAAVALSLSGCAALQLPNEERQAAPTSAAKEQGHARMPGVAPRPNPSGTGRLRVQTTPVSAVWIDGRQRGVTPIPNLELPVGRHTIEFRSLEGGQVLRRQVIQIQPNQTLRLQLELDKR